MSEEARKAAAITCEHEWLTGYLIPRCDLCGFTDVR